MPTYLGISFIAVMDDQDIIIKLIKRIKVLVESHNIPSESKDVEIDIL